MMDLNDVPFEEQLKFLIDEVNTKMICIDWSEFHNIPISFVNPFLYPIITSNQLEYMQREIKQNLVIPRNNENREELNNGLRDTINDK